ncbi:phosphopantetheine-binding protein [Amycolatopsis magusensis]|uniref:Aryl carrier-like protein n=1 Tax=Amycolatopsis magusensis TaxID=882444 RepID=A0ABS4Q1C3_9PSEU|nr:phosphopantetheine-binding protein [Amycolatopsis magusensis]MBP2184631.1 aryl carrier-like protein [Amycolatopsis magusensis]MDI5981757.1 phosphopantetheine-binding protein [Amycolatopsis magusensis]
MSTTGLTAEQIRADVAGLIGCDEAELTPDADLLDLGLDSIRIMGLIERWRAAGVTVEFADLAEQPQLGHWTAVLAGERA